MLSIISLKLQGMITLKLSFSNTIIILSFDNLVNKHTDIIKSVHKVIINIIILIIILIENVVIINIIIFIILLSTSSLHAFKFSSSTSITIMMNILHRINLVNRIILIFGFHHPHPYPHL